MVQCFDVTAQRTHFCDYRVLLNITAAEESVESYTSRQFLMMTLPRVERLFLQVFIDFLCYVCYAGCFVIVFCQWYCLGFLLLWFKTLVCTFAVSFASTVSLTSHI